MPGIRLLNQMGITKLKRLADRLDSLSDTSRPLMLFFIEVMGVRAADVFSSLTASGGN